MKNLQPIYFRKNKYGSYFPINLRKNTSGDLTFVFKGTLTYFVEGKQISVKGGDAIFIDEGVTNYRIYDGKFAEYASFNFKCDEKVLPTGLLPETLSSKIKLMLNLYEEEVSKPSDFTEEKKIAILEYIIAEVNFLLNSNTVGKAVKKIKDYINDNICGKITLSKIGKALFYSPYYCESEFKKETGITIIDYVNSQKIAYAKTLISEGLKLTDIANKLGFTDYNYFSRIFKKYAKSTPKQYRQMVFEDLSI